MSQMMESSINGEERVNEMGGGGVFYHGRMSIIFFLFSGPSDWLGSWDHLPRLMGITLAVH